jgi:hypothetical protein
METNTSNLFELQVDHEASNYLRDAARWAKFLAIVGFIGCGLVVLFGLFAGTIFARLYNVPGMEGAAVSGLGAGYAIFYILMALLYFFPCLYTYNFGRKMQVALRSNDQTQLIQSFKNLKSCYRFLGILTIIWLGLVAIGMLFAIIGPAFR